MQGLYSVHDYYLYHTNSLSMSHSIIRDTTIGFYGPDATWGDTMWSASCKENVQSLDLFRQENLFSPIQPISYVLPT